MTALVKQTKVGAIIRTWAPLILSLAVNIYLLGFKLGAVGERLEAMDGRLGNAEERIAKHSSDKDVHMPLERKFDLLVSRREYSTKMAARDDQVAELRALLIDQGHKLDRIWERLADHNSN